MRNILGEVGNQLETVDDLGASVRRALDAKGQDTTKATLEVLLRDLVAGMALKAWIRHPVDTGVLLEPAGKSKSVAGVSLSSQAEGLNTKKELLSGEGVEGGSKVTENLNTDTNGESDRTEGLPELQAVIALGWLNELGESLSVLAPVELAAVNNNTGDGRAVTANPLRRAVDDDIRTVINGSAEVAASTECVVDLNG